MGEPGLAEAGVGGEAVVDLVLLQLLEEVEGVEGGTANDVRKTGGVLYRKQSHPLHTFFSCANAARVSSFLSLQICSKFSIECCGNTRNFSA